MQLGTPDVAHESPRGQLRIWFLGEALSYSEVTGVFEASLVDPYVASFDAWLDRRSRCVRSFSDWSRLEDYDTATRVRLTDWTLRRSADFEAIHLFTRSKIVHYGIKVANVVLRGSLRAYDEAAPFEAALEAARGAPAGLRTRAP